MDEWMINTTITSRGVLYITPFRKYSSGATMDLFIPSDVDNYSRQRRMCVARGTASLAAQPSGRIQ